MSSNIDLIVKRLLDPQFGSDTTERLLMGSAADAIRYLQGELAEALAKTTHLAKQEVDIRTAYGTVRADNMQLVRESKRLEREWAASEARALAAEAKRDRLKVERDEARQIADDLAWAEKKRVAYAKMLTASLASDATPAPTSGSEDGGGDVRAKAIEARKHLIAGDPLSAWRSLDQIIAALSSSAGPAVARVTIEEVGPVCKYFSEIDGRLASLGLGTHDLYAHPAPATVEMREADIARWKRDSELLSAIQDECWDVRFTSTPNADAGDYNVNIEIVSHFMAEPQERVVGENYNENLRAALEQAMTADAYPPARPVYDLPAALAPATERDALREQIAKLKKDNT